MKFLRWVFGFIALVLFAPMLGLIVCGLLEMAFNCSVNEGGVTPCVVAGYDLGPTLTLLFGLGFISLTTMPFLFVLVAIWIAVELLAYMMRRRKLRRLESKRV